MRETGEAIPVAKQFRARLQTFLLPGTRTRERASQVEWLCRRHAIAATVILWRLPMANGCPSVLRRLFFVKHPFMGCI